MSKKLFLIFSLIIFAQSSTALAASRSQSGYSSSNNSGGFFSGMMLDLSAVYLRDTRPEGISGVGTRASLGGMLSQNVGIGLQGTYELKTNNYLVGADIRLMPVSWLFFKAGIGGYSLKESKQFMVVPMGGFGINAPITEVWYLVAEATYFQARNVNNITFGAGLGVHF